MAAPLRKKTMVGGEGMGDPTHNKKIKRLKNITDSYKQSYNVRDEVILSEDDEWKGGAGNVGIVDLIAQDLVVVDWDEEERAWMAGYCRWLWMENSGSLINY